MVPFPSEEAKNPLAESGLGLVRTWSRAGVGRESPAWDCPVLFLKSQGFCEPQLCLWLCEGLTGALACSEAPLDAAKQR